MTTTQIVSFASASIDTSRRDSCEAPASKLCSLPDEVLLSLITLLPAQDILAVSQVCADLQRIVNDDAVWRALIHADKETWDVYVKPHTASSSPSRSSLHTLACDSKQRYMWQAAANHQRARGDRHAKRAGVAPAAHPVSHAVPAAYPVSHAAATSRDDSRLSGDDGPSASRILEAGLQAITTGVSLFNNHILPSIQSIYAPLIKKPHYFFPMFGEGMDSTTAKDLLYCMMWANNTKDFKVSGMYPGVNGVGGGVVFDVCPGAIMNVSAIHKYGRRDMFHENKLRPEWKGLLSGAHGLVFVVNEGDNFEQARHGLDTFVTRGGVGAAVPLLMLLCYEGDRGRCTKNVADIAAHMGLEDADGLHLHRPWHAHAACLDDLAGVWAGLRWLLSVA